MSVAAHRLRRLEQQATAGAFAPTDIAGCIAWWDSSDAGSFSYHSGTLVSQWDDLSGNANHLVQASSGNAPSRTGTQNGLTVVTFDGSNDYLACTSMDTPLNGESDYSVAIVYTSGTNPSGFAFGTNSSASARGVGLFRSTATIAQLRARNAAAGRDRNVDVPSDGWRTIVATADASDTSTRIDVLRSNGTDSTYSETSGSIIAGAAGFTVGCRASGATAYMSGSIGELIFYDNIIAGSDITDLEDYLRAKWATW